MEEAEEMEEKREEKRGFLRTLSDKLTEVKELARRERVLVYDILMLIVGLLFARCHIAFGSYPLGIAFIASLSSGLVGALLGAVIGALSLGRSGIIFAIATTITVFIRVIISGGGTEEEPKKVFSENLLLRMCSAVIGGFISTVYHLLLNGINISTVLYGVSMILLPPALTFVFSGVFLGGYSMSELLFGARNLLSLSGKSERERYNILFFELSGVVLMFFLALSLADVVIVGISFSYIFIFFATLLISKRFGSLRALTAGFLSSLGVSGVYSVSAGLLGLASGGLFGFGLGYALIGGGLAASLWAVYSSGLVGLVSVLPEYSIAALIAFPLLKRLSPETTVAENLFEERNAKDMIGTMALVYQKQYSENLDGITAALGGVAEIFKRGIPSGGGLDVDDLKMVVYGVASDFCRVCPGRDYCRSENIDPCRKNADRLARKLLAGEKPEAADINLDDEFCQFPEEVAQALAREAAKAEKESYRRRELPDSEEYELMQSLISEARAEDEAERAVNNFKSEQLNSVVAEYGFKGGAAKVFGDRRLHLFVAGEDPDGEKITSENMRETIEKKLAVRLTDIEYFKRDSMVLMECKTGVKFSLEYASSARPGREDERSGDTVYCFESTGGYFYCLISDGMGSGSVAADTSRFVADYLEKMLGYTSSYDTVMQLLNRSLRSRRKECSATLDLFVLDRFTGEVTFIKSGAAPSYIKRDGSIFRIRSKTAPLGLLSSIDSERIKVETRPSDYIIMLSDGVAGAEESPWLLELLAKPPRENLKEYAELILKEAEKFGECRDDMSVAVMRIKEIV